MNTGIVYYKYELFAGKTQITEQFVVDPKFPA